jgi:TRAP-type C4-dicarboxylate transport system permease small subunit
MTKLLQQISLRINAVVEKLLLVIGGSICIILFAQVLSRYIGASHLLVAITFLGGTAAYKRMSFIGLKGIGHSLGRSAQKGIVVALQAATLGCFCILAWFGTEYTIKAWEHTSASLQIPMSIPFAVIPISAMVFIVHVLSDMATTFERRAQ